MDSQPLTGRLSLLCAILTSLLCRKGIITVIPLNGKKNKRLFCCFDFGSHRARLERFGQRAAGPANSAEPCATAMASTTVLRQTWKERLRGGSRCERQGGGILELAGA